MVTIREGLNHTQVIIAKSWKLIREAQRDPRWPSDISPAAELRHSCENHRDSARFAFEHRGEDSCGFAGKYTCQVLTAPFQSSAKNSTALRLTTTNAVSPSIAR